MRSPLYESRVFALASGALVLVLVALVGCTLHAAKQTAVPPPPSPAAVPPAAPETPLSIPQTAVTLPGYQEVNPDAIPQPAASAPVPEKPEAPPSAPRAPHRSAGPAKPGSEPESEPEAQPPAVQEQAPIQPILSSEEQKRIQRAIDARRKEIDERLYHAKGRVSSQDPLVERINSFLQQCDLAKKSGDYAQADALSERALILARELPGE